MAKVIDLTESDGDFVIIGRSLVLPSSDTDSLPSPLNGALRFNPSLGRAQVFFDGSWTTLGSGSGSSGGGNSDNNHTHTIAQILGLQTALNNKAPVVHTHALADITGLTSALASKAPAVHLHGMSDITGLDTALAGKAAVSHTHSVSRDERIAACFPGNPPALYKLVYTSAVTCTLPVNLVGSFFKVRSNPAAGYTITLFKNVTTPVGTVLITPTGSTVMTVGNPITLAPGDTLTLSLPAKDTAIDTISFALLATRPPQLTS